MDLHLIKSFAKGEIEDVYAGSYINIKFVIALPYFLILLILSIFIIDLKTRLVLILYSFSILSSSLNISWYFQSYEKMKIVSLIKISESFVYLSLLITFLIFVKDIIILPVSIFISQSVIYVSYIRYSKIKIKFKTNFTLLINILKQSFPLGLSSLSVLIYYNFDILLLKYFKSEYEIGIYNAAVKIFLFSIIPLNIILTTYFPKLSKRYNNFNIIKGKIFRQYLILLISVGFVTFLIIFLGSDLIVKSVYKIDYENSALSLKILAFNIILVAVNIAFGNPLIALNKYKQYMIAISSGAIFNILINIIMIPKYSYIGASYTTVASEGIVLLFLVFIYMKNYKNICNEKM